MKQLLRGNEIKNPLYIFNFIIFVFLLIVYLAVEITIRYVITAILYPFIILMPIIIYIPVVRRIGISMTDKLSFLLAMLWFTLICRFIAEVIWCWYYDLILHTEYPFPGISDILTVLAYIFINVGMYVYVLSVYKELKPKISKLYITIAILIVLAISIIIALVLLLPIALYFEEIVAEVGLIPVIFFIMYTIPSIALVAITIFGILAIGGRIGRVVNLILISATLVMIFAVSFSILSIFGLYYEAHPIELFDLSAYLVVSLAFYEMYRITK